MLNVNTPWRQLPRLVQLLLQQLHRLLPHRRARRPHLAPAGRPGPPLWWRRWPAGRK
jgi:hypothetical protein